MIYLFCSASRPLYKRDALECACYPSGHLFRFRYEKNYVDPAIFEKPRRFVREEGLIVFLDTAGADGQKTFDFLPIRKVKIIRLFQEGLALYIDFKFGDFVNYGPENVHERRKEWSDFFENLPNRPWPPSKESGREKGQSEGYFVLKSAKENPTFPTGSTIEHEAWENLVRRLNKTNDLKESTFFQILGFYTIKRGCYISWLNRTIPMPIIGSLAEVRIQPNENSYDSIYPLPMGRSAVLKILFSRPTYDSSKENSRRSLELKFGTESFAGASKTIIYSESRYNEERIILVCKRVFDSFLSPVTIEQKDEGSAIICPKPFFLTRIKIPKVIIVVVIAGVVLSTLLVGIDSESIRVIGGWAFPGYENFFDEKAKVFSAIAKWIAPVPMGISAYFAFRRLPLK